MMGKLEKFLDRYGYRGFVYLVFYPVLIVPLNIYALLGSLYNILRSLARYNWRFLSGNTPLTALNNYFYYVQDLNIQRFGRYGRTHLLADGDFSLKTWFHVMPVALRFQSSFGTVFMLFFAMLVWTGSWFFIMECSPTNFLILLIALFSTYFFANFIDGQNYNVLAWMFLPLAFSSLVKRNYLVYGLILSIMSFLSFTAVFVLVFISLALAFYWQDVYAFLSVVPAIFKVAIPVTISLKEDAVKKTGKLIGIFKN